MTPAQRVKATVEKQLAEDPRFDTKRYSISVETEDYIVDHVTVTITWWPSVVNRCALTFGTYQDALPQVLDRLALLIDLSTHADLPS